MKSEEVEEEAAASPEGEAGRPSHTHLHPNAGTTHSLLIPVTTGATSHHLLHATPPPPNAGSLHSIHSIPVPTAGSTSEEDEGSSTPNSGHHSLSHGALTPSSQQGSTLVQYGGDSQFYLPVSDLQNLSSYHHLSTAPRNPTQNSLSGSVVIATAANNLLDSNRMAEVFGQESTRKREVRLAKNREAARECRRKKKDYVKCLENRVAVLENQNKALIEELKSLKDLYCNKQE